MKDMDIDEYQKLLGLMQGPEQQSTDGDSVTAEYFSTDLGNAT